MNAAPVRAQRSSATDHCRCCQSALAMSSSSMPGHQLVVAAGGTGGDRPSKRRRGVRVVPAPAMHGGPMGVGPWWPNPMMMAPAGQMGHLPAVPPPPQPMDLDESSESEVTPNPAVAAVPKAPVEEDPAVAAQRQAQLNLQQVRAALFIEPTSAQARDQQRINRNYATLRNLPKA